MTKEQVEMYGGICDQIIAFQAVKVSDTVQGSSTDIPYQKRTISIEGVSEGAFTHKIQTLKRKKSEIEAAVNAISSPTDQAIIYMRVIGRLSWSEIAAKLGYHYSQEGVRKAYKRAMKKYF